jgi:hypothetical protein
VSTNPLNLALRLLLELAAMVGLFRIGLTLGDGGWGLVLAIAMSVSAMTAWGVFNVPGDPSRSGRAPVPVPGRVRLLVEITVLGLGATAWTISGPSWFAWAFGVSLVVHYGLSWDRVGWLTGPEIN